MSDNFGFAACKTNLGKQYPGWEMVMAKTAMVVILRVLSVRVNEKTEKYRCSLHAVQNDELRLILHDRIAPAAHHLGDSIHAAGEYGDE